MKQFKILLFAILVLAISGCGDDEGINKEMCGVWLPISYEYYINGEYSSTDDPVTKIYVFKSNGKYQTVMPKTGNTFSYTSDEHGWSYDSDKNILNLWGNVKYKVVELNSNYLILQDLDEEIYGIYTYRRLSSSECDKYGIEDPTADPTSTKKGIPETLVDTYLHFYYDDTSIGKKGEVCIWNISDKGASFEVGEEQIYYTTTTGPTYTYKVTGSKTATYAITFRRWVYVMGEQIVGNPITWTTNLTFYTSDNARGTFVQTASGGSKKTGRFYLGDKTGPGDWGN